jgi:hypothetical protein
LSSLAESLHVVRTADRSGRAGSLESAHAETPLPRLRAGRRRRLGADRRGGEALSAVFCKECGAVLDGRKRKKYCADCRPRKQERRRIDWEPILAPDGPAVSYVERVTDEQDGVPPSNRDLLYYLVEEGKRSGFPNDLSAYTVLCRKTAELRDEMRFPALDDATRRIADRIRLASIERLVGLDDLTVGQPAQIWVAVEKRGLVPRMERAFTEPYGIPVVPLGGFASQPLHA